MKKLLFSLCNPFKNHHKKSKAYKRKLKKSFNKINTEKVQMNSHKVRIFLQNQF